MKTPLTPTQALNNFRLLLELDAKGVPESYLSDVRKIASAVLESGIAETAPHTAEALIVKGRGICLSFSGPVTPAEAKAILKDSTDVYRIEGTNGYYEREDGK